MKNMTVFATAVAIGVSSLLTLQSAHAEAPSEIEAEASSQSGLTRFFNGIFAESRQENAQAQNASLVSDEKSGALEGATRDTSRPYSDIIARHARQHGVPEVLAHAVIQVESNYRANARGQAGEIGLMQIKPATARGIGFSGNTQSLYDPETNIRYGMKYLGQARQLAGGDLCGTILRYNAGHAATRMNRISANYCSRVQRIMGGA